MRILLVYPEFPATVGSFKREIKFSQKQNSAPPLGLLTVAAMLPPDWEKRLVDLNITRLTDDDLAWAGYVFISAMLVQRESAQAIITRCKAAHVKVAAGGPLFTLEHERFPDVDYFLLNEAELTLPSFVDDLYSGRPQHLYTSTELPDIQFTPTPLWRLAKLRDYDTVSIQFSRGCPFTCDFCNATAPLGHQLRTKNAAQILAELNGLQALGWRKRISFVDDNFTGNQQQIKSELLPALIKWRQGKIGMPFSTEASLSLADDPELMRLMALAGFDTIFVGSEPLSTDNLAECGQNQNKDRDLVESVRQFQRAGFQVQGRGLVSVEQDPVSIFQQQMDTIQKNSVVMAVLGLLQSPLNVRLYEHTKPAAHKHAAIYGIGKTANGEPAK